MRQDIGEFLFDAVDDVTAARVILGGVASGVGGRVVTPNVDILRRATCDIDAGRLLSSADLVLADGMPVVWAARLRGQRLPGRVPGSALGPLLAGMAAERAVGVFLLGGADGTARRAAKALASSHPGLRVGWHFPPFGFEDDVGQVSDIEAALEAFGPCVCLVGLGFPRQDRLGERLLARFPGDWFIGVGATLGFMAGDFRRAPEWAQRSGLEWVHRLSQEPSRLAGRYLRDIPFVLGLLASSAASRFPLRGRAP